MIKEAGALLAAAGAYLLAIMPGKGKRAEKMAGVFYAHRGLHNKKKGKYEED